MIEVRNLTKRYGDRETVKDISFTVEEGHIYGFLGPNGAGKSTTMNIITGYIAATEGQVLINGYDILRQPRKAKACIGYLPEQPPLYSDLTVREYLNFAAEIKGIAKDQRKEAVDAGIAAVMLGDVEGRLIKNLSKGYKQRVGFAQALTGLPQVLILDEPTSGLDPKQIIEIRDLIKKLGENHTVILSSHILSEISAVCDHVIMISDGKIVADDSLENLTAEKSLEEIFLELTDADRMEAMDVIDLAREEQEKGSEENAADAEDSADTETENDAETESEADSDADQEAADTEAAEDISMDSEIHGEMGEEAENESDI